MSRVCAHCGEVFEEEGSLVCPHCGADVEYVYAETPSEFTFDDPEMDGDEYARFLEREGLAEPPERGRRAGCASLLLLAALVWAFV